MSESTQSVPIGKPATDEYDAYYETYVGKVNGATPILHLLRLQQAAALEMFASLDDRRALFRYADGKPRTSLMLHLPSGERSAPEDGVQDRSRCHARAVRRLLGPAARTTGTGKWL